MLEENRKKVFIIVGAIAILLIGGLITFAIMSPKTKKEPPVIQDVVYEQTRTHPKKAHPAHSNKYKNKHKNKHKK